ncbi:MAG TPA: UDP-N-acetylglucosamine 1-carboxyvinyltransferase [Acidimicrobiales bacterium]|nr:UDP-N-acetylglucosamine 1-carboxyvinyltransferase [Acidimicrobiales bacterium]
MTPAPMIEVAESGPLEGEVAISGAKNSVLKLMAASLLVPGRTVLLNVPDITDVTDMAELLGAMGCAVTRDGGRLMIDRPVDLNPEAPYELVESMRASIEVLGPLLAGVGRARVALPGGDDFGHRPIDLHLAAFEAMGAHITSEHGYVEATAERLLGTEVNLEFPSVGATENVMMAATLAKGTTVIENAAREPELSDLASMLNRMGANITGIGSSRLVIEGVEELSTVEHTVIPDRIEAATFLVALGVTGGELTLRGARHDHMDMLITKLGSTGMRVSPTDDGLWAMAPERPRSTDVSTLPYPGVATDYKPLLVALLCVAEGTGIVTENIFGGRFRYVSELVRMGADIRVEGHHAVVRGCERLSAAPVRAPDIRAGAALVLAALRADGVTHIADAHHIDRGYEDFVGKLSRIGATIRRIG